MKLIRKIALRIIAAELAILFLFIAVSFLVLLPGIRNRAIDEHALISRNQAVQVNGQLERYTDLSRAILHTQSLLQKITAWKADPTSEKMARISLELTEQFCNTNTLIRWAMLEMEDGIVFRSAVNSRAVDEEKLLEPWYQDIKSGKKAQGFSAVYDPGLSLERYSIVYSFRSNIGSEDAIISLFLNCQNLVSAMSSTESGFDSLLFSDRNGRAYFSIGDTKESFLALTSVSSSDKIYQNQENYYFVNIFDKYDWCLTARISDTHFIGEYRSLFFEVLMLYILFSVIALIIILLTIRRSLNSVKGLSDSMHLAAEGDINVRVQTKGDDEIAQLGTIFNDMLKNLQIFMQNQIQAETKEEKMKYNLLLSQIDSHFIGNTLSTVNSLSRQGRSEEVVALNTALLKILQNNLRIRAIDVTDTVAQEMETVEQYWIITKIRSENNAVLHWDVPDELLEYNIPKNILQPFVENSLFHGLTDEETGEITGNITISIRQEHDNIIISIEDDGKGIPEMKLAYLNDPDISIESLQERGKHIGIVNVRQRLYFFYKTDCVQLFNEEKGTRVRITIPREEKGENYAENL